MGRRKVSPALFAALFAAFASLCLQAPAASAAGFDLRWNACAADGGAANRSFACDTDEGTNTLVASFRLDQPITGMVFFDAVLDLIVANDQVVPPWWGLWEFSDCRVGALFGDVTIDPAAVNCADWSGGTGDGGVTGYNSDGSIAPGDAASHRRILVAGIVNTPGVDLAANQDYFLFNVHISNSSTTGEFGCAGCSLPVCIVLNSIRLSTVSAGVTTLATPTSPGNNFATWQGGSGADCMAVPTRQATWGAVKSLYR